MQTFFDQRVRIRSLHSVEGDCTEALYNVCSRLFGQAVSSAVTKFFSRTLQFQFSLNVLLAAVFLVVDQFIETPSPVLALVVQVMFSASMVALSVPLVLVMRTDVLTNRLLRRPRITWYTLVFCLGVGFGRFFIWGGEEPEGIILYNCGFSFFIITIPLVDVLPVWLRKMRLGRVCSLAMIIFNGTMFVFTKTRVANINSKHYVPVIKIDCYVSVSLLDMYSKSFCCNKFMLATRHFSMGTSQRCNGSQGASSTV